MITINNKGRFCIPDEDVFIGFAGDNLNVKREFFLEGVTDPTTIYRMYLLFDDGTSNFFLLDKELMEKGTKLIWNIESDHIFKSGIVILQIKGTNSQGKTFHTCQTSLVVQKSIEFSESYNNVVNSEFLQQEEKLNGFVEKANAIKSEANELYAKIKEAQIDSVPTENSESPVTSGGVHYALSTKLDDADNSVKENNIADNAVTSGKIMNNSIGFDKLQADTMIDKSSNTGMAYAFASDTHIPTTGFIKAVNEETKDELKGLISEIPKFNIAVVNELPTDNISDTTIYLLASGSDERNIFTEYVYVDNNWEKLGTQTVDLSNYVLKTDFATAEKAGLVKPGGGLIIQEDGKLVGDILSSVEVHNADPQNVISAGSLREYFKYRSTTSISETSTDTQFPTARAVYNGLAQKLDNGEGTVKSDNIADNAVTTDKIQDSSISFQKLQADTMIDTSSNSGTAYAFASDTHIPTTGFVKAVNRETTEKLKNEVSQINEMFNKRELLVNLSSFKDETTGEYINKGRYAYNPTNNTVSITKDEKYACISIDLKAGVYAVQNIRSYFSFYVYNGEAVRFSGVPDISYTGVINLPVDTTLYITIETDYDWTGYKTVAVASGDTIPNDISRLGIFSIDTAVELDSVKKLRKKIPSVVTVKKDGTGDFTTLKEALAYAKDNSDLTIKVYKGTYDLIEEFGEDYFANLTGPSTRQGLQLRNGVHLIFSSGSKVVCHYKGDNDIVKTSFSPFNFMAGTKGFTLENLTLEASNVRCAINEEAGGAETPNMYKNTYKNCKITIDNSNNEVWRQHTCIGGGLGTHGEIIIENCSFIDMYNVNTTVNTVNYRNGKNEGAKSRIIVTGCYFSDNTTFRLSYYGNSTEITEAYVSNCSMTHKPFVSSETSEYTIENVKLVQWNNEIRTP